MNNVYALVEHFYEKNIDAEDIVSQGSRTVPAPDRPGRGPMMKN
jgi:hypothetical protein